MMKNILLALYVVAFIASSAFSGIDDALLQVSSDKFDYYTDGSKVEDGEWYALVWSPHGHDFAGFNADFTAISDQDAIVLAAPLAKNGKCRDVVFQVPKKQYEDLKDGNWQLCLLDTRGASGKPLSRATKLTRVARWTIAGKPKISASIDNMSKLQRRSSAYACKSSSMPKTFTSPKISSIAAKLKTLMILVESTFPYAVYALASSLDLKDFAIDTKTAVDGNADAPLQFTSNASESKKFFKVVCIEP